MPRRPRSPVVYRPQWLVLVGLVPVCLLVAGLCGFAGLWVGQQFENVPPHLGASLAWWTAAGLACGTPVACLPVMRFPVRRGRALAVAAGIAAAVTLAGVVVTRVLV